MRVMPAKNACFSLNIGLQNVFQIPTAVYDTDYGDSLGRIVCQIEYVEVVHRQYGRKYLFSRSEPSANRALYNRRSYAKFLGELFIYFFHRISSAAAKGFHALLQLGV